MNVLVLDCGSDSVIFGLVVFDVAELTVRRGCDLAEYSLESAPAFGDRVYEPINAEAPPEQMVALERLSPTTLRLAELAGEPVGAAPGEGRPIGGIEVVARHGWCAVRPSGTEAVYKLYAESFTGRDHLRRIQKKARAIIQKAFEAAGGR